MVSPVRVHASVLQTVVFIERQYKYIHQTEEHLNNLLGEEIVAREGKYYLSKYPLFSDWAWTSYTIIFPSLLIMISLYKILEEWGPFVYWPSLGVLFDSIAFVAVSYIHNTLHDHDS